MYRLQKIDELLLPAHQYLTPEDECYFFMTYTRLDQGYTAENDLILNFKKGMDRKNKPEWRYKVYAIHEISNLFVESMRLSNEAQTIFVPIPPSWMKGDPLYDDRIIQVIQNLCNAWPDAQLREIISLNSNKPPTHRNRMSPDEIVPYLDVDETLCVDQRSIIVLVDDVITNGAHFKACKRLLQVRFPNSRIIGLFVARTLH
jgi:predicted amidophosphoribosyltransferase